jgi:hypothetical protein
MLNKAGGGLRKGTEYESDTEMGKRGASQGE